MNLLVRADHVRRRLWPGLCIPPAIDGSDLPLDRHCGCGRVLSGQRQRCLDCARERRRRQNRVKERRYYANLSPAERLRRYRMAKLRRYLRRVAA